MPLNPKTVRTLPSHDQYLLVMRLYSAWKRDGGICAYQRYQIAQKRLQEMDDDGR
jgi:hypothetical protein